MVEYTLELVNICTGSMREEAIYEISVGAAPGRRLQESAIVSFLSFFFGSYSVHYLPLQYFSTSYIDMGLCGKRKEIFNAVEISLCILYSSIACSYPKEWDWDYGGRDDASIVATVGS